MMEQNVRRVETPPNKLTKEELNEIQQRRAKMLADYRSGKFDPR